MAPPRKRDERRFFSHEQKAVLFLLAHGNCQACGESLDPNWHADHIEPWTVGGRTELTNAQALCSPCNLWKGSAGADAKPRPPIHSLRPSKEPVRFAKNNLTRILARLKATEAGCLEWQGKRNDSGYGVCMMAKRWVRVHRYIWEYLNGALTRDRVLHHTCKNKACANPWHLEPCTIHENLLKDHPDYYGKANRAKVQCIYGHPLSGANLYIDPRGFRMCRECQLRRKRAYNAELKQKRAMQPPKVYPLKQVCSHGHSLSGGNLYVSPDGDRHCRACRRENTRAFLARQREVE